MHDQLACIGCIMHGGVAQWLGHRSLARSKIKFYRTSILISTVCNFWPQLQISGGSADPLTRPSQEFPCMVPDIRFTTICYGSAN